MAVSSSDRTFQVISLKGQSNYQTWKVQVRMALIRDNVWGIVSETELAPSDSASAEYTKFSIRRDKALATIVLTLDPDLIYLIGDAEDPVIVWKLLQETFQKKSVASKFALRKKLINTKMSFNASLQSHAKLFSETYSNLAAIGEALNNDDKVFYLLCSLPESYDMVVTTIENCGKLPDFQTVLNKLLEHEKKMKERQNEQETETKALYAKKPNKKTCNHCHKPNHFARDCWILHPELRKSNKARFNKREASNQVAVKDPNVSDCVGLVACQHQACSVNNNRETTAFIVDSGATCHMTNNSELLSDVTNVTPPEEVILGDGRAVSVSARGNLLIDVKIGSSLRKLKLHGVLLVPQLSYNLVSIAKATEAGITTTFYKDNCVFSDENGNIVAEAQKIFDLYYLKTSKTVSCSAASHKLWHRRLGHIGSNRIHQMSKDKLVEGLKIDSFANSSEVCEPCISGKISRFPFPSRDKNETRDRDILELIHSDVCGKMESKSLSGCEYFVSFTDDKSRYVWTYFMKNKSDVFNIFKSFKTLVEKETGKVIKIFRTDNGGEYCSSEFERFLKENGIKHETSVPVNPEQNGVAERLNRTLVESVRTLLADSKLEKSFWAEALNTATYIKNRSATSTLNNMTPFEAFKGKKPSVAHFKPFGCNAYAHIPKENRRKLDEKSRKCIMLGYSDTCKGYRLYDIIKKKVFVERNVLFNENVEPVYFTEEENGEYSSIEESPNNETKGLRRSERVKRPPDRYGEFANIVADGEPNTVEEAVNNRHWKNAMDSEMLSMKKNNVFDLVKLPPGKKVIKSKWIFKVKQVNGKSFPKARLVAQGYSQIQGEDYNETFAPVVRFESIRTLIALAAQKNMKIHQMDIKTAFLNGDLQEEIYLQQPQGFIEDEDLVWRLNKSIYGLKQSPRCWNASLDQQLISMGFEKTASDPCIYKSNNCVYIGVYVDDLIIVGQNNNSIMLVKTELADRYELRDLGLLSEFLGVKVVRKNNGDIWLGQPNYTAKILHKFSMISCNSVDTPADPNSKLVPCQEGDDLADPQLYQSAVGSLIYLSTKTRPDLAFAVHQVSRYNVKPSKCHWSAVKRIFRYLKGTSNLGIRFSSSPKK